MGEMAVASKPRRLKNKKLLAVVLAVLAFVVIVVLVVMQAVKKPEVAIGTGPEVPGNVEILSREEQEKVSKVWVPIASLDMDWTLAKAVALTHLDKPQEALDTYRSLDSTGKAPYYVYLQYSSAAAQAGDLALAAKMLDKAIDKIDRDSSIDSTEKTILKRRLVGTAEAYREDAKQ